MKTVFFLLFAQMLSMDNFIPEKSTVKPIYNEWTCSYCGYSGNPDSSRWCDKCGRYGGKFRD